MNYRNTIQKGILICAILFIQIINLFGQWEDKSIMTSNLITSTSFVNEDFGFATAQNEIYRTEDGGDTWAQVLLSNTTTIYEDIFTINDSTVIAVGRDFISLEGVIISSSDSGNTWNNRFVNVSANLRSVFFISDEIGYACGSNGTILKSSDGGIVWMELESGTTNILTSVFFVNDSIGFVVGGSPGEGEIFKTENAGDSWQMVSSPSNNFLQSIFFINDQIGYSVGWNGEILNTTDCGDTWSFQNSVSMEGNLEIVFTDQNTGYIVGGSLVYNNSLIQKTNNGGQEWIDISPQGFSGLLAVDFPTADIGYVAGAQGIVLKTTTAGVITSSNNNQIEIESFDIYPNPTNADLTIVSSSDEHIELLRLYDGQGMIIKELNHNTTNLHLDLSNLIPNVYYLEIHTPSSTGVRKVVKL